MFQVAASAIEVHICYHIGKTGPAIMLFIPLPFAVALFLMFLLVRLIHEGGTAPAMRPFLLLIAGAAAVWRNGR